MARISFTQGSMKIHSKSIWKTSAQWHNFKRNKININCNENQ